MEQGERFIYLRGKESELPQETAPEKLLRLLAVQHPTEESPFPQADYTALDLLNQMHPNPEGTKEK